MRGKNKAVSVWFQERNYLAREEYKQKKKAAAKVVTGEVDRDDGGGQQRK